jgi:hypothetical protein
MAKLKVIRLDWSILIGLVNTFLGDKKGEMNKKFVRLVFASTSHKSAFL